MGALFRKPRASPESFGHRRSVGRGRKWMHLDTATNGHAQCSSVSREGLHLRRSLFMFQQIFHTNDEPSKGWNHRNSNCSDKYFQHQRQKPFCGMTALQVETEGARDPKTEDVFASILAYYIRPCIYSICLCVFCVYIRKYPGKTPQTVWCSSIGVQMKVEIVRVRVSVGESECG